VISGGEGGAFFCWAYAGAKPIMSNGINDNIRAGVDRKRIRVDRSIESFNPESNMTCHTLGVNLGNPPVVKYQNYASGGSLSFH
jgi:hypothetical protein